MESPTPDRRSRKRLETRQKISDIATCLFVERGFDNVTVDEIAAASDVSRMTVFNYFARKEDMFYDVDDVARQDLLAAFDRSKKGTSPLESLRQFAHWAVAEQRPYARFSQPGSDKFFKTVETSDALKSRARAIRDEYTDLLTNAIAQAAGTRLPDPHASLAASMLVAAWIVAAFEANRIFRQTRSLTRANTTFLSLIDQSIKGIKVAVKGTPYA